jgi:hypothetical protein
MKEGENNENENENPKDGSDLERLFNLLRKAKDEYLNSPLDDEEIAHPDIFDDLSLEPDSIETHVEGGVEFIISKWHVPGDDAGIVSTVEVHGSDDDLMSIDVEEVITRLMQSEKGSMHKITVDSEAPSKTKTLSEQLKIAVEKEDYDLAVVLRDEIATTKNRITELIQRFNKTVESGNKILGDIILDEIRVLKNEI